METSPTNNLVVLLLKSEFSSLIQRLCSLTRVTPSGLLYKNVGSLTVGAGILKTAGVMEQAFGGITSNLWDDPFEWTLPEALSTPELILEYLADVDLARERAFSSITVDSALYKLIALPSGESCRLLQLLMMTLQRSSENYGQAAATLKFLSDVSASGFII